MDTVVSVNRLNDVYAEIDSNEFFALKELVEYFTFKVPGAEFMPTYRNKVWDGKIRLLNPNSRKLYLGLVPLVEKFCSSNNYKFEYPNSYPKIPITSKELESFTKLVNPHSGGKPIGYRDYQIHAIKSSINKERILLVSPTASGKSLIIYSLVRFYNMHPNVKGKQILIIVPTTSLVEQMYGDFKDYGWDVERYCHKIYQGQDKITNKKVVISTWQSIYKMGREYFDQFGAVIGDECHLFKANSLNKIMEKMVNCRYRIGTTGTLDGTKTHKLVLNGLFGDVEQVTTTKKLIDNKTLSDFKIKCLVLKYSDEDRKFCKKHWSSEPNAGPMKYSDEIDWLITNQQRQKFITNLAESLEGNTLVLFNQVIKQGKPLYESIQKKVADGRPVFYVSGEVKTIEREEVRKITEISDNAIIVASYGTFSTGINIKKLHNVVFASPSKSRVRNLQSIGRALRKGNGKTSAVLYDVVDDLKYKTYLNFAMRHFYERINIDNEENFDFSIHEISMYKED